MSVHPSLGPCSDDPGIRIHKSAGEGDLQAHGNWTTPLISEAINDYSSEVEKILRHNGTDQEY